MRTRHETLMPGGVPKWIRCYDNSGKTFDRFTVCYTGRYRKNGEWFQHVGMSKHPFHPQGFGQHGESQAQLDVNKSGFAPAIGRKNHLGTRIGFESLPDDCRKLVVQDYKAIWKL